jgi:putative transposase
MAVGAYTAAKIDLGRAELRHADRACVLLAAKAAHPDRFLLGNPIPPPLPSAAWISKPKSAEERLLAQV